MTTFERILQDISGFLDESLVIDNENSSYDSDEDFVVIEPRREPYRKIDLRPMGKFRARNPHISLENFQEMHSLVLQAHGITDKRAYKSDTTFGRAAKIVEKEGGKEFLLKLHGGVKYILYFDSFIRKLITRFS